MVQSWYIAGNTSDPRLAQHKDPPEYISLEELYKKTGIQYIRLNINTYETDGTLDKVRHDRGYKYEDEVTITEECLKKYSAEHLHADEEIRLILEGAGCFDVRDDKDEWVRIAVTPGDLVILPAGIYHRFKLDTEFIKQRRFFTEEPVWKSYNRPAEDLPSRKQYVALLQKGFAAAVS